jgi:hypothetical protein
MKVTTRIIWCSASNKRVITPSEEAARPILCFRISTSPKLTQK